MGAHTSKRRKYFRSSSGPGEKCNHAVEYFLRESLKAASFQSIKIILSNESSRLAFVAFLRDVYFRDEPELFDEVKNLLQLNNPEAKDFSEILGDIVPEANGDDMQMNLLHELVTLAFPEFLGSKDYKRWRAEEKGSLLSITASPAHISRVGSIPLSTEEDLADSDVLVGTDSASVVSGDPSHSDRSRTGCIEVSNSPRQLPLLVGCDEQRNASFAQTAFERMTPAEVNCIVEGSTWLSILLCGVECAPLPFALVSAERTAYVLRGAFASILLRGANKIVPSDCCVPKYPLVFGNASFGQMLNCERIEMLGRSLTDWFEDSEDGDGMNERFLLRCLKRRRAAETRIILRRKGGESFSAAIAIRPILDQRGVARYFLCLFQDLSAAPAFPRGRKPKSYKAGQLAKLLEVLPGDTRSPHHFVS